MPILLRNIVLPDHLQEHALERRPLDCVLREAPTGEHSEQVRKRHVAPYRNLETRRDVVRHTCAGDLSHELLRVRDLLPRTTREVHLVRRIPLDEVVCSPDSWRRESAYRKASRGVEHTKHLLSQDADFVGECGCFLHRV